MKGYGIGMAIAGVLLAIGALLMGSTLPQEVPYSIDLPSLTRTQEMHNLPRAQLQSLLFAGGCALFVAGVVLGAIGQLEETLVRRGMLGTMGPDVAEAVPASSPPPPPVELTAEELEAQEAAEAQMRLDQERWAEQARVSEKRFGIGAVVVIGAILLFLGYLSIVKKPTVRSPAAAETVENLEMMADNLEAQAEATSAEANAAGLN